MNNLYSSLNIGVRSPEVNSSLNSSLGGVNPSYEGKASWELSTGGTAVPMTGINPHSYGGVANVTTATTWPSKTAVDDFLKIQYTAVEVRCAITRKMVPAGSPVMLLGGMVISQEAFENWLEEHLAGMICRHQDVHTDTGYVE